MPRVVRRIVLTVAVGVGLLGLVAVGALVYLRQGPAGGVLNLFADGQRAENFRTLHQALPSHPVAAGGDPWAFDRDERPLPERYTFDGEERALVDLLRASETTGLLVARNGAIVHEAYFEGHDERSLATSFSVAKSFTSALVGIALERGQIRSLDDAISDYVPELIDSGYEGVAIRDVLTMSSGIAFDEDYARLGSDVMQLPIRLFVWQRPVVDVLAQLPREREPGALQSYASSDAQALGLLLARVTGGSVAAFLEEAIWRPAGMESDAAWGTDLHGQELTYAFLAATLRDYARFGRLYLNEGRRDDVQVLPAAWVAASVRPGATATAPDAGFGAGFGYGYQWWVPDGDEGDFLAMGIWGQFVYVHPGHRVVIVKTSTDPGFAARERETIAAFRAIAAAVAERAP
ncbi:MAG: serine hydrolase domain-containing protein [Trueperaceae bacterium]